MSNLIYTLKGEAPLEWLLDVDVPPVGNCWRIWEKLSIIAFLCFSRESSSDILIGYPTPSSLFSSSMGDHWGLWGWSCNGSSRSSPNSLYPDCAGDRKRKIERADRSDTIDPDLCRNAIKYRNIHKHRDGVEIMLHFINIKELKYAYRQYGNKLAQAMVSYLWEYMWRLHPLNYNEARRPIYYRETMKNPKNPKT